MNVDFKLKFVIVLLCYNLSSQFFFPLLINTFIAIDMIKHENCIGFHVNSKYPRAPDAGIVLSSCIALQSVHMLLHAFDSESHSTCIKKL